MMPLANWKKQTVIFLSAQTISLFGSAVVQFAIIWHIVLNTVSGTYVMLSTLCAFLPQIAVSLFSGVLIDRYDRKKLIMLADGIIAVATLLLIILFAAGIRDIWLLLAALVVRSAGTGIQTPAVNAFIPQIVPTDKLIKINGINASLNSLTMFMAPAVSGIIFARSGIVAAFAVDVITAVIGISLTTLIREKPYQKSSETQKWRAEFYQGLNYLKKNLTVKKLLIFQLIVLFLVSPSAFLTPLLIARSFGAEVWRLSVSEMFFSAGAIAGGILIAAWGGFTNRLHTIIAAGISYGLLMAAIGLAPNFYTYLLFNGLIGITMPLYNAPLTTFLQEHVSSGMQGKIFSFMQIATAGALPAGMVVFGPLADIYSVQGILTVCGTILILLTAFFALWMTSAPTHLSR